MITAGLCNSYKRELLDGVHAAGDVYRMALIRPGAERGFGKATASYADLGDDEVKGDGYLAGGRTLGNRVCKLDGDVAFVGWDDAKWEEASLAADGALIYNATKGGRAVAVIAFGGTVTSTNANFVVAIPAGEAGQIRLR